MVGVCNAADLFFRQLPMDAINESPHFTGVYKEGMTSAVTEFAVFLVPAEKPEADRYLRCIKKLTRHGDHAINQVRFDDVFRISSSLVVLVDMEPLARIKPATPVGER